MVKLKLATRWLERLPLERLPQIGGVLGMLVGGLRGVEAAGIIGLAIGAFVGWLVGTAIGMMAAPIAVIALFLIVLALPFYLVYWLF